MADNDYLEEDYFHGLRKEARLERKIASRTDRSKYKKTDQDKIKKREQRSSLDNVNAEEVKKGRVFSIRGQGVKVDCEGKIFMCALRGLFKKDRTRQKNIVAVGDFVQFIQTAEGEGSIVYIDERKSVLSRADNIHRRKVQMIATNIDQVLITVSCLEPPLKPPLIDRYIIATRQGNMQPVIIINKMDLLESDEYSEEMRDDERLLVEDACLIYESLGIPIITLSADNGEGIDKLKAIMKNKASVFSGQSGVGKSSLINAMTGLKLRTREIVGKTRKGAHTTTRAELLPLELGGWCVDTPGIGSFGVWNLKKSEIKEHYEEIKEVATDCRFADCCHDQEPGCAVKEAVEEGDISPLRYDAYLALMHGIDEEHRPR